MKMISELFSENAKQQLFEEFSNVIDDLATQKAKQLNKRYLNKTEAYEYLNISYGVFTNLVNKHLIKRIEIPNTSKTMFDRQQLDEFMASNQI